MRWLRRFFDGKRRHRKEMMEAMIENREAEASLWRKIARACPPGSAGREEAEAKHAERSEQARRLRYLSAQARLRERRS